MTVMFWVAALISAARAVALVVPLYSTASRVASTDCSSVAADCIQKEKFQMRPGQSATATTGGLACYPGPLALWHERQHGVASARAEDTAAWNLPSRQDDSPPARPAAR